MAGMHDELIEMLEKAKGPNFELEQAIFNAVAPEEARKFAAIKNRPPPNYTYSIDAALTLVPDGWAWRLDSWHSATARVFMPEKKYEQAHRNDGKAAIALCIAALRARNDTKTSTQPRETIS